MRQVDGSLLVMVEEAARRGNQDIDAALQLRDLRIDADSAIDDHRGLLRVFAVDAHAFFDLRGELAGGGQDQRADGLAASDDPGCGASGKTLENGQHESGRLAGAGLRAGEQIAAREHRGDRLRLDRGRRRVSVFGDRADEFLGQAELGE